MSLRVSTSITFAPNPTWSHFFSPGGEIQAYFARVADDFDHARRDRVSTEIVDAAFVDDKWRIRTAAGEEGGRLPHLAAGVLRDPQYPKIKGLRSFQRGRHAFSSIGITRSKPPEGALRSSAPARPACRSCAGLRRRSSTSSCSNAAHGGWCRSPTALFENGTSGPRQLPMLGRLAYRTYRGLYELLLQAMVRPGWQRTLLSRVCRANLRTVRDPELRRRLTPDYQPMCRRLISRPGSTGRCSTTTWIW